MSYYFIANIRIEDEKEYQQYINQVEDVFKRFNGKYLCVDNHPEILEGNWDYSRSVVIEFGTKADFNDWYYSDAYQNILNHRLKAAICDTILVKGLSKNQP